ncbi:hypothetical protein ASA1KI_20980 [Opitutales bacterium ASA1]|uniref:hypothetical protein n=1 Tax=Congregicoccus parvus TaxID=3081749 RepID=UPI002B28F049|nr:hypothetical protein ASA1KI_20980 [Opitutales bacterium ASA1]
MILTAQDLQALSRRPAAETAATHVQPLDGGSTPAKGGQDDSPSSNGAAAAADALHVVVRSPDGLVPHELLAHIPERSNEDPDYLRLYADIAANGIHTPAIIDGADRILCGRHRVRIARKLRIDLPVRIVPADQAASIILSELVLARHLPKGALAYVAVPLLDPVLEAGRERRLRNLQQGQSPKVDSVDFRAEMGPAATARDLAVRYGFSYDTFVQARRLRELLDEIPALQAREIERQLFSGELGLGYAITAATNVRRNAERPSKLDKRQEHARLFLTGWKRTLLHWNQATEEQRAEISRELRAMSAEVTPELRSELRRIFS